MAARPVRRFIQTVALRRRRVQFFLPTIRAMAARASPGLFGPRRSDAHGSGPFARRSALRPSGRTAAVIYGDRPPGSQQQPAYSDRGDSRIPGAGIVYPNDDRAGLRPPGAIGATAARRTSTAATRRRRRRQAGAACRAAAGRAAGSRPCAASAAPAPPGSVVRDQGARRHHRGRYVQHPPLLRARWRPRDPLRRPRRPRRLHLDRRAEDHAARPSGRIGIRRPR